MLLFLKIFQKKKKFSKKKKSKKKKKFPNFHYIIPNIYYI